jgi:hypothetical protein
MKMETMFQPHTFGNWGTYFKGLLTENRERYLGEQETDLEGMNEIGMDKINLDIKS